MLDIEAETDSQRTALTDRVSHFTEPVEWIEDYYTGANTDRDGYQKMLKLVNAGHVIDITAWRCDRIGRNALENLKLAEACKARSTDIVGHADGLRLNSPNGSLIFTILSAIAEYEREKISENTKAGMATAKEKGKILGGSPQDTRSSMFSTSCRKSSCCGTTGIHGTRRR